MNLSQISASIAAACRPSRFFLSAGGQLRLVEETAVEVPWEIYRGHLLDPAQTRQTRSLDVWQLLFRWPDDDRDQPLIVLYYDRPEEVLFVARHILTHGWETFESAPNVIESRPAQLWRRELVATIPTAAGGNLAAEVTRSIEFAVLGTSRLPITSLESPLPAFSLGQLAYFPFLTSDCLVDFPISDLAKLIERGLPCTKTLTEESRLLEVTLRAAATVDVPDLAKCYARQSRKATAGSAHLSKGDLSAIVRTMFNQLALSPYTGLGERLIVLLQCWAAPEFVGAAGVLDLLGFMLRHLVRHLTAYDLITFHNRGANYPDALFLDGLLKAFLSFVEREPALILPPPTADDVQHRNSLLRRRALRQGWLARKACEGLLVPAIPTSPGENLRVLPAEYPRASEEELQYAVKRGRKLFSDDCIDAAMNVVTRQALEESLANLALSKELQELGTATYLDRPLGVRKSPGEIDRTPLLSYEAFSREIAIDRLKYLRRLGLLADDTARDDLISSIRRMPLRGQPVASYGDSVRAGVVALEDAFKAAQDFVFLSTTRQSLDEFFIHFDWQELAKTDSELAHWLQTSREVLLIRQTVPVPNAAIELALFDGSMSLRASMSIDMSSAVLRQGVELPAQGLRLQVTSGEEFKIPLKPSHE